FCDSSQKAYGVCVYLCTKTPTSTSCHLVFAKSRVAPLAGVTLPRLELIAVYIGSKCLSFVEKSLAFSIDQKFIWTDSQWVLHWLHSRKPLSVFVKNRIEEIKRHQHVEYRYVPTADNPADHASRGKSASDLIENQLWWHGPKWLILDERKNWPPMDFL